MWEDLMDMVLGYLMSIDSFKYEGGIDNRGMRLSKVINSLW